MSDSLDTKQIMLALRHAGVPDPIIAAAFNVSRQSVHAQLGSRDPSIQTLEQPKGKLPPDLPELPEDPDAALPQALYQWRTRRDLSQTEAAGMIGVSNIAWSAWERGSRSCALPVVMIRYLELMDRADAINTK